MPLEHDLLAIEKAIWTGGPEAYGEHLEKQCLVAFKDMAGVMSRDDIMKSAEKGRWKDVSLEPKGMAELSSNSVVISYECHARRKDGEPYHALVSSGYAKHGKAWKLAFHQQTQLDDSKG